MELFLFNLGYFKLDLEWLQSKRNARNISAIIFALKHGDYAVRTKAATYLGELEANEALPALLKSIHDSVPAVAHASLDAIEGLNPNSETQHIVNDKRAYLLRVIEMKENSNREKSAYFPPKKERTSKKTFNAVKQMLKKPMNGGKWF